MTTDLSCMYLFPLYSTPLRTQSPSDIVLCNQGVYCIAAIWSNLELFLGVIAANLALSRAAYVYFRHGKDRGGSSAAKTTGYYQRSGYINQYSAGQDDAFGGVPSTIVTSSRRRASIPISESSDIPLEPGIHMKTSFVVVEEFPDDHHRRRD